MVTIKHNAIGKSDLLGMIEDSAKNKKPINFYNIIIDAVKNTIWQSDALDVYAEADDVINSFDNVYEDDKIEKVFDLIDEKIENGAQIIKVQFESDRQNEYTFDVSFNIDLNSIIREVKNA